MTDYQYSTIEFAGIQLDTFLTEDGRKWVTLSSMANGLGQNRQSPRNWINLKAPKQDEVLNVRVGQFRKQANAYPIAIIAEYVTYLADRGVASAKALLQSTLQADLERSISEANGIQVTAAQHEENRASIRYNLCVAWSMAYEQGDRNSFYAEATAEEVALIHQAVHYNRLLRNQVRCKGYLNATQKSTLAQLSANPEVVRVAEGYQHTPK